MAAASIPVAAGQIPASAARSISHEPLTASQAAASALGDGEGGHRLMILV